MTSTDGHGGVVQEAWRDTAADLQQAVEDLRGVYEAARKRVAELPAAHRGPSDGRYCKRCECPGYDPGPHEECANWYCHHAEGLHNRPV